MPSHFDRLTESIPSPIRRYATSLYRLSAPVRRFATDAVRIDTRTLAVFRMLLGLLIVADILLRSRNFDFFYTESGVVPQSLAEEYTADTAVSVYYFTTDPTVIAGLFVLTALVGIALAVGYRSRIAAVLAFLLVISLDHHNPLVLSFADTLFRLLLFWAIFLPLGERWSVDAVHRNRLPRESIASVATALILIQVVVVYLSNGIHKAFSDLWRTGEAATLVLGLDNITFLFGETTRAVPTLLQAGGFIWFAMLLLSWLLFVLRGRYRTLFALMFISVHASFAITVRIGAFPYVSIAGVLLFLQAPFWRDLDRLVNWLGFDPESQRARIDRLRSLVAALPNYRLDHEQLRRVGSLAYSGLLAVIVLSILLVVAVLLFNLGGIVEGDREEMDDRVETTLQETTGTAQIEQVAVSLGIDQPGWSIFAPIPRTTDRYYVFAAETADGEHLDVYNDRELTYERPYKGLEQQFGTYRERFYMNSIRRAGAFGSAPGYLADYHCERYAERGTELERINMYVAEEQVSWETIDAPDERDREFSLMSQHSCGDADSELFSPPPSWAS